jgi:hypothetical protein
MASTVTCALPGGGTDGAVPRDPALVRPPEDTRIDQRTTRHLCSEEGEADGDG